MTKTQIQVEDSGGGFSHLVFPVEFHTKTQISDLGPDDQNPMFGGGSWVRVPTLLYFIPFSLG